MDRQDTISGGIYIALGALFLTIGLLGASYLIDPADAHRPFITGEGAAITKPQAGAAILPLGLLGGLGMAGFGRRRLRATASAQRA